MATHEMKIIHDQIDHYLASNLPKITNILYYEGLTGHIKSHLGHIRKSNAFTTITDDDKTVWIDYRSDHCKLTATGDVFIKKTQHINHKGFIDLDVIAYADPDFIPTLKAAVLAELTK